MNGHKSSLPTPRGGYLAPPRVSEAFDRQVCVCVIGCGYVGESLLQQFGNVVDSIGYDISSERIEALQSKYSDHKSLALTTDPALLARGTHFLIAVPTPIRDDHTVDLSFVVSALEKVVAVARPRSSIVIESSVPVGTTRKLLGPYQAMFYCGMSPERIDPGRAYPTAEQIPKVVSGLTPKATKSIVALYKLVYRELVPVSKPEVAEMTKLHENCYRMVNIAYVNEISDACVAHGVDAQEMIQAASTKPFGFQPFYPGLGVGGHCLPVNPWYLFHNNKQLKVLQLATSLMAKRPCKQARRFFKKCQAALPIDLPASVDGPRILIVGLGFKNGQSNIAHSPALAFARTLQELQCRRLAFFDPTIKAIDVPWMDKLEEMYWTASYLDNKFDGIAVCNDLEAINTSVLNNLSRAYVRRYAI